MTDQSKTNGAHLAIVFLRAALRDDEEAFHMLSINEDDDVLGMALNLLMIAKTALQQAERGCGAGHAKGVLDVLARVESGELVP